VVQIELLNLELQNEGEIRNYFDNLKNEIEESDFAFNKVIDFTAMTPDQIRNDDINDPDLIKALNSRNEQDVNKLDDARYEALKELVSKSNDANLISRLFGISSLTPDQIRELDKDDPSIDKAIGEVNTNELSEEQDDALSELLFSPKEEELELEELELEEEEIPVEETGETPDDWQDIARQLGFSTDDTEEQTSSPKGPIEAPEEEMGEEPSDWGSIQNELSSKSLGEMTPDEIRNSTRQELTELLKGFDTNQFSDDQMDAFLDVMA
jgi:protein-tyrosine-phosphatase